MGEFLSENPLVLLIWLVGWPVWTTLAPPRAPEASDVRG